MDDEKTLLKKLEYFRSKVKEYESGKLYKELHYVLDENKNPVPETDEIKWAAFITSNKKILAQKQNKKYKISTIFVGLCSKSEAENPPLFETSVFDLETETKAEFYELIDGQYHTTYTEAMKDHNKMCQKYLKP